MADRGLRLLSLDGGGVRGLSSLYILRSLMEKVEPDAKDIPKPCDYFDMIGGTSTGGLIAIMLGRLEMSVDQCIAAYTSLSEEIFAKESKSWTRFSFKGDLKSRFDAKRLEKAIIKILHQSDMDEGTLLSSPTSKCKVFVCAANQKNETVVLRSYHSPRDNRRLSYVKIWEACRATSAAQGFFDPIAIPPGKGSELFTDGGIRANNPVKELWAQACDLWATDGSEPQETELRAKLRCLVSVGTGRPDLTNYSTSLKGVVKVLTKIATDTEAVAESFARDKPELFGESQYFRFNVDRGLKGIGLDECDRLSEITAATGSYIERQAVFLSLQKCAGQITKGQLQIPIRSRDSTDRSARQDNQNVFLPPPSLPATVDRSSPFHIPFKLDGVVHADQFVPRPEYTTLIEQVLLQDAAQKMRIYVLHGMGGIGKTQLAINFAYKHKARFTSVFWLQGQNEDALRQSLVKSAKRIPKGQISDESRRARPANAGEQQDIIDEVMDWLSQEGNHNWLLIFDNIDLDPANADDRDRGAYSVNDYLPGDQGSVLITSRLASLAQIGSGRSDEELSTVTHELSKEIFERWYGKDVEDDEHLQSLLGPKRLSGLPLAIAQAAVYFKQNQPMPISEYIRHFDTMWPQVMGSGDERPLYNYHAAVGVTWALSMQQVREQNEIAERLVQVWALIDNQGFGFELFQDLPEDLPWDSDSEEEDSEYSNELPAWLITLSASEASFQQCLQLLQRYRLASRDVSKRLDNTEPRTPRYAMRPLVHRWAGQMQTSDQRCAAARAAVWLFSVCGNTRHQLFRDGVVLAYFKPHVHKYLHGVFQDEEIKSALLSSTPSITALRDIASYQELEENLAVRIYRLVLESGDGHLKLPWALRLVFLVGLGKALEDEDPEKAAALVPILGDQAQGLIGRKVDSAEEFDVSAWASFQLARFTRHIDPQRAETLLQDLLRTLPESNSQTADVMLELARFLVRRKEVSLAMSRAREALDLIEKYHSEDTLLRFEGRSTLVRINLIQLTLHSLLPDHVLLEDTRTMANEVLQSSIAIHATISHETNQVRLWIALLDILAGDFEKADSMLQSVLEFIRLTADDTLLPQVTLYATLMSYCLPKQGVHQRKLGIAQQLEIDGSDIDWDSISTLAQTVPVDMVLASDETIEVDRFWTLVLSDRTV